MNRRNLRACLLLALAAVASTSTAAAEEKRKPKAAPAARCPSFRAEPVAVSAIYEQAFCLTRVGNWAGALNAAARWLEHPDAKRDRKKIVRERILPHASKIARVVFEPADAEVLLDGEPVQTASGILYVAPGPHAIVAHTPDGRIDRPIELYAGETRVLEIPSAGTPARTGQGPSEASAPSPDAPPVVGAVVASEPMPPPSPVVARGAGAAGQSDLPVLLALGGAALVAAGAGTWLLASSASERDDAAGLRKQANHEGMSCYGRNNVPCSDADDLAVSADRKSTIAVGCFAGAGAILATTLFIHLSKSDARERPRIVASPTRGGAVIGGSLRF